MSSLCRIALVALITLTAWASSGTSVGADGTPVADPGLHDTLPCDELDPTWTNVEQWLPDILTAQQQVFDELGVQVPTTVVMAVIMIETQGIMPSEPSLAGAVGLMAITPNAWGADGYDLVRATTDAAYSIYIGVKELAFRALDSKNYNQGAPGTPLPWRNVIVGAFSGHYVPVGSDDGYNSDFEYQRLFDAYMAQLEAECPGTGVPGADTSWPGAGTPVGQENWLAAVGTSIDGLAYLWGGADAVIAQEFGPTDFSINVHPDWYAYALAYGFEQPGHTGIDIAMPVGTPLYAPTEAVVVCAGTDNPAPQTLESCGAFTDVSGAPTSGRLQVRLPNGDMLIYGQVRASVVEPGATVSAGQLIGYSGSMNGDHLHLEYRTIDPSTDAGWRIIDPRLTSLNGLIVPIISNDATPCPASPVAASGDGLLEISEVTMWDVATPESVVPGSVEIDESGTDTHITTDDGTEADVSISPTLEVPFETVTEYQVGCAEADE